MNTCFKHFYLFIKEFNLVAAKEFTPIQTHIDYLEQSMKEIDSRKAVRGTINVE